VLTFDTETERKIEIGREYKEDSMEQGQCYALKSLELNLNDGDLLYVKVPMSNFLNVLVDSYNQIASESQRKVETDHEHLSAVFPCKVK
jgi:hypothetical protein